MGLGIAAAGEAGPFGVETATALARLGELVILAGAAALMLLGGVLTRAREALPLVARSPEESRIFRVAMLAGGGAVIGSAVTVAAARAGVDVRVLGDAVRHLVTIGVLTSVVVAMVFRLVPVLEGRPLRWPRLRAVALWSLAAGILVRSAEVLVGLARVLDPVVGRARVARGRVRRGQPDGLDRRAGARRRVERAGGMMMTPRIPKPLTEEHEELHAELVKLTRARGKVGEAARAVATLLHPHFVREEEYALPPLGLLAALAAGPPTPEMRAVVAMTDRLRAELPQMLTEHKAVLDARSEEQVLYPAAILVGEYIKGRTGGSAP